MKFLKIIANGSRIEHKETIESRDGIRYVITISGKRMWSGLTYWNMSIMFSM